MKKLITAMMMFILVFCFTITPVSTTALTDQGDNEGLAREYANITFDSLSDAASACTPIMNDIYRGWHFGIFENSENDRAKLSEFSSELSLSKNEVIYGIESTAAFLFFGYEHAYQYFEL